MASLLRIRVQDPQNAIDTYGAGALIYIERGTSSAMSDAAQITTVSVVAGTTEYEYRDQAGTPYTDWYRYRIGKSTISTAADASGYSTPYQAGAPAGEIITLETVKTWTGIEDTTDDGWLPLAVGAINRVMIREMGVDIGPSPDTTRDYDADDAVQGGTRLWIPGGIRTFTAVSVSTDGGSTFTAVTSDVRIGPAAHLRTPGEPGAYVEFKSVTTGSYSSFPSGSIVRITCPTMAGFGWDAYPYDLVQEATSTLQRMAAERDGRGAFPTETVVARYLKDSATLAHYRHTYFPGVI